MIDPANYVPELTLKIWRTADEPGKQRYRWRIVNEYDQVLKGGLAWTKWGARRQATKVMKEREHVEKLVYEKRLN